MTQRTLLAYLQRLGFAVLFLAGANVFAQWTEPELMPPPINVTPPGSYYYSTISADGQVLCMTIETQQGFGDDDVYISERIGDSSWTVPVNAGPNVNNEARNLSPSITSDRQRLYYVKWTGQSYDIFVSHRTGPNWDDWSAGEALPTPVNVRQEFTCQISFDDSTLVFTSDGRPGPLFGQEVMCTSRLQPDGSWSNPIIIAPHLNQINGSLHPCLTDSGETLVYGMFGGPSLHFDIFFAVRNDTGFGNAVRCDSTINTAYWDSGPSSPVDGSYVIFESLRLSEGTGAHRLFQARRITSNTTDRPETNSHPCMSVIPSFGTFGTEFKIDLPTELAGSAIQIYNINGQLISSLTAGRHDQTTYHWKGTEYARGTLSSGVYFVTAEGNSYRTTSKIILLH